MKLNLSLLKEIFKKHGIKGQAFEHRLEEKDNVSIVREYINSVNWSHRTGLTAPLEAVLPEGPARIDVTTAVRSILSVSRLLGVERTIAALDKMQQSYGGLVSIHPFIATARPNPSTNVRLMECRIADVILESQLNYALFAFSLDECSIFFQSEETQRTQEGQASIMKAEKDIDALVSRFTTALNMNASILDGIDPAPKPGATATTAEATTTAPATTTITSRPRATSR